MIDFKVRAPRDATKKRIQEKSLFTRSKDQLLSKRPEAQPPSFPSGKAVASLPVARSNGNEGPLVRAASQRSPDSEHEYARTGEKPDNGTRLESPLSPAPSSLCGNSLLNTVQGSLATSDLNAETASDKSLRKDSPQMSLPSSTTYSSPDALRPSSSLYSTYSFNSSISDFFADILPINRVQDEKSVEKAAWSARQVSFQENTEKITIAREDTRKLSKSNTMQPKPRNSEQELTNKPLPAIPVSGSTTKLSKETHLSTRKHIASLLKYEASAPGDESPIDKYFPSHRLINRKQTKFNLESELHRNFDLTQKEEHVVAPLNTRRRSRVQELRTRHPSRRSGSLPGPTNLKAAPSTRDWSSELPLKLDDEGTNPITGGLLGDIGNLISDSRTLPTSNRETCRLSTGPPDTFVRDGMIPQLRHTVVSKYADNLDDFGLYTRSFILDSPFTPSPAEGKSDVVGDGNDSVSQGEKIFIKLNRVENVTLNFHILRPSS